MKKDNVFILILAFLLTIISILAWRYPNFGQYFDINNWFNSESVSESDFWKVAFFVMVACFLGALIPMPVPYALPVATFSYLWFQSLSNPWIFVIALCLLAALANTIGDCIDYLIGRGTNAVISKDDPGLSNKWAKIILSKPKAVPFVIFLFALTSLPDSLLLVPLGFVKYSPKKMVISMYLGKVGMMLMIALAGIYAIAPIMNLLGGAGSWITGVALLWGMFLIILFMLKLKPKE